MNKIRWGIIATGVIANKFAGTIQQMDDSNEAIAVASRTYEKAKVFAQKYGIPKAYGSYEEMLADEEIDAVYIGTPHNFHYENMMLCLKNNKHVLCEKAFTTDANQARQVFEEARKRNLFVMEAFWTRFNPMYGEMEKMISEGVIGDVWHIRADFGIQPTGERNKRKLVPELAGGALLDLGVYCIGFTAMVLGYYPKDIFAAIRLNEFNTDGLDAIILKYENGTSAQLTAAMNMVMPCQAVIYGTMGRIEIPRFLYPTQVKIYSNDSEDYKTLEHTPAINGFEYEIAEAASCILNKKTTSDIYPPEKTIAVMEIMDKVRAMGNFKYPFE